MQGQAKMGAREFESRWPGAGGAGGKCERGGVCGFSLRDKAPRLASELGPCTVALEEASGWRSVPISSCCNFRMSLLGGSWDP